MRLSALISLVSLYNASQTANVRPSFHVKSFYNFSGAAVQNSKRIGSLSMKVMKERILVALVLLLVLLNLTFAQAKAELDRLD